MFTVFSVFYTPILNYLYRNEEDFPDHNGFNIVFIAGAYFFPDIMDPECKGHKR